MGDGPASGPGQSRRVARIDRTGRLDASAPACLYLRDCGAGRAVKAGWWSGRAPLSNQDSGTSAQVGFVMGSDDSGEGVRGGRLHGVVWNAWSRRPVDMVVYDDGLLLLLGHALDVARVTFRATPSGWDHGRPTPVERSQQLRVAQWRAMSRSVVAATVPGSVFIPVGRVTEVRLGAVAGFGWLTLTTTNMSRRTYFWVPTMNYRDTVRDLLSPVPGFLLRG